MRRFFYAVIVATLVTACGGGGGGSTGEPPAVTAPNPPSNNTLTIEGNVSYEPGTNATVSTSFGGRVISTISDLSLIHI